MTVNGIAANNDTASGTATVNWSATVTLVSSLNTITVVAKDMLNNSTQKVVSVTYNPRGHDFRRACIKSQFASGRRLS